MKASETLTLAADRLDTLLADATSGPWVAHTDGLVWAQRPGDPVSGSSDVADADYIATMDPLVGRAVVVLLRHSAARVRINPDALIDMELILAQAILGEVAS